MNAMKSKAWVFATVSREFHQEIRIAWFSQHASENRSNISSIFPPPRPDCANE
ncbi:Unknown protein sequence [Pseudomonas coronafaciens pv. oryzae]|nr:Unknown protein sequence [Pseudomonas coronafaciens pv. oryzae]